MRARALGWARGGISAAGRVRDRLDPRAWLVRNRRADLYVPAAYFAAGAAVLLAFGEPDVADFVVGLPAIAFILLVLVRAYRASVAQRGRDLDDIADARFMVLQCRGFLRQIARSLPATLDDYRVRLAMGPLSSAVRMFGSRYRRYLNKKAVWAAMEADSLIMRAELSRGADLGGRLRAIGHQIEIIDGGIVGVDERGLRDVRDRI